jgi:hypothetical protein
LAACNPYREKKVNSINAGLVYIPKNSTSKALAFKVKPPCLSMIQLMWDYQQLKEEELHEYVENIILEVDFDDKNNLVMTIVTAHEHFKR